jgi:hypothetical protein
MNLPATAGSGSAGVSPNLKLNSSFYNPVNKILVTVSEFFAEEYLYNSLAIVTNLFQINFLFYHPESAGGW